MAASRSAWGIEIGAYALKALRLERDGDEARLSDFTYVPHKKVLSTPDLDQDEMIRLALGQFMSQQRDLADGPVLVSVPGNSAFARFAKLPPVEPKKVPDIVRFEAFQQIPFSMEEVEWDYETFSNEGSPDVEVGIFALTKAYVAGRLALYGELGLQPDGITLSPVAAYNGLYHDLGLDENAPGVIFLDIGTISSDLIVAQEGRVWIRTFPIGGHNFTEALISSFKLTYSKAEKLKAEAQTSKYRRQILSAMRPVFSDLAQEVQRSIGYYQSLHRDAELGKLIGIGSTFKLPGLRKFLSQQLQIEVTRLDAFQRLNPQGRNETAFSEHSVNFATAYGLALQGLELANIDVNLIPVPVVRERLWGRKIKWFGAAAAVVVLGSLVNFARPVLDRAHVRQDPAAEQEVSRTIREAKALQTDFQTITDETAVTARPLNIRAMLDYRDVWPAILNDVGAILASAEPQPELFDGLDASAASSIPVGQQQVLELRALQHAVIKPDARGSAPAEGGTAMPQIAIQMVLETPNDQGLQFVNATAMSWLRQHMNATRPGVPYRITEATTSDYQRITVAEEAQQPNQPVWPGGGPEGGGGRGVEGMTEGGGLQMEGGRGMPLPPIGERGMGGQPGMGAADISRLAELPKPAVKYPPGSQYHRMTIRWTIQLLSPEELNAPASAGADEEVQG